MEENTLRFWALMADHQLPDWLLQMKRFLGFERFCLVSQDQKGSSGCYVYVVGPGITDMSDGQHIEPLRLTRKQWQRLCQHFARVNPGVYWIVVDPRGPNVMFTRLTISPLGE